MLLLQQNLQATSSVSFSIATTDGADVDLGNTSVLANSAINTTDGADLSVANTSIVISGSFSNTDGADVASISVSIASASVSVSINSTDGADIASANIATVQSSVALSINAVEDTDLAVANLTIVSSDVPVGGGYDDEKKKRRYVVRIKGKLLVFKNESDAITALQTKEVKDKQYPKKKKAIQVSQVSQPIVLPAPQPIEQIDLQAIVDYSIRFAAEQEYQFLLKAKEYEALLNLYKKFKQREEEEIIFLLMAA